MTSSLLESGPPLPRTEHGARWELVDAVEDGTVTLEMVERYVTLRLVEAGADSDAARQEGYEEGHREGRREAEEQLQAEVDNLTRQLDQARIEIDKLTDRLADAQVQDAPAGHARVDGRVLD